jgi:hypothetical protein
MISDPHTTEEYKAGILNWAIEHFGPDCAPTVHDDDTGPILSVSRIKHGKRETYHVPLTPLGGGLFTIEGSVTVDANAVH